MDKIIVFASGNKEKLKEVRAILSDYTVIPAKEMGYNSEPVENGNSFYENALIKAKAVAEELNLPALADDSGICVDALNGEPGIYSARYAGDGNDEHNNDLLLKNLQGCENRAAKYVCAMVYYTPNGEIIATEGEANGKILLEREGTNGFGYDPIFFSYDLNKSLGVATSEEKNKISHRYRALKELFQKLEKRK